MAASPGSFEELSAHGIEPAALGAGAAEKSTLNADGPGDTMIVSWARGPLESSGRPRRRG